MATQYVIYPPTGSSSGGGTVDQGSPSTLANAWPVKVTDGTDLALVTAGGALQVDASGTIQPVSGTVTANQGAPNTAANAWFTKLTDGTDTALVSGAGALLVDGSATTQPVSGTVAVSNFPATQPVSGTVSVSNFPATQPVSGTVTADQGGAPWSASIVESGNTATVSVAGALTVDGSAVTQPVSGTVAVSNFPATQPVSGTVTAELGTPTALSVSQAAITVGTSAVRLTVSGSAPSAGRVVLIGAPDPSSTALFYVGGSSVTSSGGTQGIPLIGGDKFIANNDAGDYYIISDTAAQTCFVLEQA